MIIPAFNAEETLERTLRSVAAQTYPEMEILIVDDGSTDGTAKLARDFCTNEPRARLLSKRNGGVASARNLGIAEAAGTWVAPIDADDLWHPTKLEKQVAAAVAAPEPPGFVYCWYRQIDRADRIIASGPRFELSGRIFRQLAYSNVVRNGSALLISTAAARAVGGYDESLRAENAQGCEDVMLQLRLARGHPVACVPEHLVGYRADGEMSGDLDQIVRSWELVYRRIAAEEPSVARPIVRWVKAKSAFDDAESRAMAGNIPSAAASLARALTMDPSRSAALLLYKLARAAERACRRPASVAPPTFFDVDPAALQSDRRRSWRLGALVNSIELRRLRAIAATENAHP